MVVVVARVVVTNREASAASAATAARRAAPESEGERQGQGRWDRVDDVSRCWRHRGDDDGGMRGVDEAVSEDACKLRPGGCEAPSPTDAHKCKCALV